MSHQEPTNQDILKAIQGLEGYAKKSQKDIKDIIDTVNAFATDTEIRLSRVESTLVNVDSRLTKIEFKVATVESTMVTKDYLDDKLANLRGDLILLARKAKKKLETVIEELVSNHSLKRSVADQILALEPFAQRVKV